MYQDVRMHNPKEYIDFAIYSEPVVGTSRFLLEFIEIDSNREVRYYCGRDNTGVLVSSLSPEYERSDSLWIFIETAMCDDNVYIEVLNVDSDLGMEIVNISLD